jgi:hypothetical protein
MNLCTPGTHVEIDGELVTQHCVNASSRSYHGDQWVTVEMEVRGGELIRHLIDGETVIEYSHPVIGGEFVPGDYPLEEGAPVAKGYIALQAESHPIEFRKVELLDLSEK